MVWRYAWKKIFKKRSCIWTQSGSRWKDGLEWRLGGKGVKERKPSTPPVWACTTLGQNHTNTQKTTSLCTGLKTTSHPFSVDTSTLPTISLLHSQLSQAAHCSHNLKTERKCAACFWINYNFLVLTHLRRKRKYGMTFENKTLKGL